MRITPESMKQCKVLTGNAAAAHAVMLCRPDVISAYPITPATELLDTLYRFRADGALDCETVEPEGEHSVMSILIGASLAGSRTFSATSSAGLFFMGMTLAFTSFSCAAPFAGVLVVEARESFVKGLVGISGYS